jgi:alpha-1,3-rhamnosyl/mannosyltransferase
MAVGTPAITSTAPALVEVTGDAALHVDPRSVEDLADSMWRMATDPDLRATLGVRGRERARQFTWARCAAETRAVYREVLRIPS